MPRTTVASWIVLILAVMVSPSLSRAEIEVARGSLSLRARVEEMYDSNIFANSNQSGDWVTVATPSADFRREAGRISLQSGAGVRIENFSNYHEQNSASPFGRLQLKMLQDGSKIDGTLELGARRAEEADALVNARTKFDEFLIQGTSTYFPAEKIGFRLGAVFNQRDYRIVNMSDLQTKSVSADVTFNSTPKLRYFGGAGARWVDTYHVPPVLPSMDSEDFKYRVGAEGDILSKVTGQVAVGWVHRRFRTVQGGQRSGLFLDSSVVWRPDNETSITGRVVRDFDTTPIDQSVMVLNAGIEIRRTYREKIAAQTGFGHNHGNFVGVGISRRDDSWYVRESIDYALSRRFTAGIFGSYNWTDSDNAFSDYSRYIVGLSVTAIY